jgi:nonsense-mediated mRNA decay protein 3
MTSLSYDDPATGQLFNMPKQTASTISCCLCGTPTIYNKAALCETCLKSQVDITEGIDRNPSVPFCRGCERFNRSPQWVTCDLESPELMSVCLRVIKGLDKVKLVDANWIWTEPHSRRLKIRLTIQKEALGVLIQQDMVTELIMKSVFCDDCHRGEAKNSATSTVQVRQHVSHKRTFLFLEQMILRNQAHKKISGFSPGKNGLDFEFDRPQEAAHFVDFVRSVVPVKTSISKKLVGENKNSNQASYRFKHSVLVAPICKHDLVVLPDSLSRSCGNISRVVLCSKVSSCLSFVDPCTGKEASITSKQYFKEKKWLSLLSTTELSEYFVIDSTPVEGKKNGSTNANNGGNSGGKSRRRNKKKKKKRNGGDERDGDTTALSATTISRVPVPIVTKTTLLGDVEVARSIDLGVNDQRFYVRSHIGALLKPGDLVMGYDLANSNLSVDIEELPDVVLVRKKRQKVKRNNKTSGGNKGDQNEAISTVRTTLAKGVNIADNEDDIDSVFADMEEDGLI